MYPTRFRHANKENTSVPDSDVTHLLSRAGTMSIDLDLGVSLCDAG